MAKKSLLDTAMPTETNTVRSDKFDRSTYRTMEGQSTKLKDVKAEGKEHLATFDPLMEDIFSGLYKYDPKIQPQETIKSSHQFNRDLMERAMDTEQYDELRLHTKMDDVNSALATVTIAESLAEQVKGELKEQAENVNKLVHAENSAQGALEMAKTLQDIADQATGAQKGKLQDQATGAQQAAQHAMQTLQQVQQQAQASNKGMHNKIRQAMRTAQKQANDQMNEMSGLMAAWGTESGSPQTMNPEERLELAKQITGNEKLKKLAQMVGRVRRIATYKQKTKVIHSTDEVYDIELGNDISRVIPSEMALLNNKQTRKEWQRKYVEGNLMQYKLRGKEQVGKGPIICCIDSSGSMSGERELWSKAVALGLLEIAKMQKRDMAVIQFANGIENLDITMFEKNDKELLRKIVHMASYFIGGGTDFEIPLSAAIDITKQNEFKKADIVFITDGECDTSDKWLEAFLQVKKEKEVKVHTVLIQQQENPTVKKFSDMITSVTQMALNETEDIFEFV